MSKYSFDEIVSHLKSSGFIYQNSEIYGGLSNSWGCAESNHTSYRKYQYINGWGSTAAWIKSKKLLSIIESYTK